LSGPTQASPSRTSQDRRSHHILKKKVTFSKTEGTRREAAAGKKGRAQVRRGGHWVEIIVEEKEARQYGCKKGRGVVQTGEIRPSVLIHRRKKTTDDKEATVRRAPDEPGKNPRRLEKG